MTATDTRVATLRDRRLVVFSASYFVTYLGDGIFYVCAALFFTQILDVSPVVYGAVLTASWLVAMALSVPAGHLADRSDPRIVAAVMLLACGASVAAFVVVPSIVVFAVASVVLAVCTQGTQSARAAVIGRTFRPEIVTRVRAVLTATSNSGLALGAVVGGIALESADEAVFRAVFLIDAVTFVVSAGLVLATRTGPAPEREEGGRGGSLRSMLGVFRDGPYVGLGIANGVLSLHITLIDVALPLWIVRDTQAPTWSVALVFVINTALVVLLQYRVAREVTGVLVGVRRLRWAGLLLLAAMALFGAASLPTSPEPAIAVLVGAAVVLTFGEMIQTSSMTEISFRLVPDQRYGQYQGFFGMGGTLAEALGPLVVTWIVLGHGVLGWTLLGLALLLAAASVGPIVTRALRSPIARENLT
ncbi:MFS transporter [Rathayibacter tanaceti]|uniref:MFS transporter n=2 Tax=Rathayibacter tanaceti TaxID=1671680 RepID=A0A166IPN6_9MICO|nr:MFS transporter [Rathayibacter tanaceti]KZX22724.1 Major Facilitator Superfamily protein [Rathayibacter tanaceti]QHC55912.1 MFS transporter [Rathayibacter tanaceti]TCO39255.1 MFS-type transporter involved in bile tolerance (Atg22 family) [Rathayibacter tanaceti]